MNRQTFGFLECHRQPRVTLPQHVAQGNPNILANAEPGYYIVITWYRNSTNPKIANGIGMDRKTLTSWIKNRIDLGQAHTGKKVHASSRARRSRREGYLGNYAGRRLELGRSASGFWGGLWGGSESWLLVGRSGILSSSHHYFLPAPSGGGERISNHFVTDGSSGSPSK
jgi:hypothetical protein